MSEAHGTFVVKNRLGLHARAAAKLTQVATKFACDVEISRDDQIANAKSVMGVLLLCGAQGAELAVKASGEDAEEAVRAIGALIDEGFGEQD